MVSRISERPEPTRPGEPDDLPGADGERHVGELAGPATGRRPRGPRRRRRPPSAAAGTRTRSLRPVISATTLAVGVVRARQPGGDRAAVLEHGDAVADLADLLQPVRDVDDGDAVRGQVADDPEEVVDLVVVEHRRRLVHDDQPGVVRERPGHADDLLAGGGQPADLAARRDLAVAQPLEQGAGRRARRSPRRTKPAGRCARGPRKMFSATRARRRGRAPGRSWRCRGASPRSGGRAGPARRCHVIVAVVGLVRAGQHLDQGRLAGAVLAEQAVHLAGATSRSTPSSARTPGNSLTMPVISSSGASARAAPRLL